jgi:hypothetical protein
MYRIQLGGVLLGTFLDPEGEEIIPQNLYLFSKDYTVL